MLFDHVDLRVASLARVRPLYDALLPAMGYGRIAEDAESICYYRPGDDRSAPFFGLDEDPGHRPNGTRIALRGASRADVDRLAHIAREAGAGAFEPAHALRRVHLVLLRDVLRRRRRQQARNLLPRETVDDGVRVVTPFGTSSWPA